MEKIFPVYEPDICPRCERNMFEFLYDGFYGLRCICGAILYRGKMYTRSEWERETNLKGAIV